MILLSEILCNTGSTDSTGSTTATQYINVGIVPPRYILSVYVNTAGSALTGGTVTLHIEVAYTTSTGFSGVQGTTVTLSASSPTVTQQVTSTGDGATFSTASVTSASIVKNTTGKNFVISIR